ncbi:MAG: MFS transporter [Acidimicrobiales bacterium]
MALGRLPDLATSGVHVASEVREARGIDLDYAVLRFEVTAGIGSAADKPPPIRAYGASERGRSLGRASAAYVILLALAVVDSAGYSIIGPVLPALARSTRASPVVAGVIVASFPIGMLAGFAASGSCVRRFGTRTTLLAALAVVAGSTVGFIESGSIPAYLATRALMGFGSGGLWLGIVFSTLERWPGEEYLCMSRIFAAYSVGALVGPGLGAIGGIRRPFISYFALVVFGAVLSALLPVAPGRRSFRTDRSELRRLGFWVAAIAITVAILGTGLVDGVLPLHFSTLLSQSEIGGAYVGLAVVLGCGSVAAARLSPERATAIGIALLIIGIEMAGATNIVATWLVGLAILGAGIGIGQTGATGLLLQAVPSERIISAMVVWSQMAMIGYLIAPIAGGALGQSIGYGSLGILPAAMVAILTCAVYARKQGVKRSQAA